LHKFKRSMNQRVERPKNYGQKKNWSAVGAEQILERVSEHFQSDLERLKERSIRNNLARRCARASLGFGICYQLRLIAPKLVSSKADFGQSRLRIQFVKENHDASGIRCRMADVPARGYRRWSARTSIVRPRDRGCRHFTTDSTGTAWFGVALSGHGCSLRGFHADI
jgi:hypothetical protein